MFLTSNQNVTDVSTVCRRAVNGDDFRAALTGDSVGRETLPVGDVVDIDGFIFQNACRLKEVLIDGAGAFVMQVRLSHFDAV